MTYYYSSLATAAIPYYGVPAYATWYSFYLLEDSVAESNDTNFFEAAAYVAFWINYGEVFKFYSNNMFASLYNY